MSYVADDNHFKFLCDDGKYKAGGRGNQHIVINGLLNVFVMS